MKSLPMTAAAGVCLIAGAMASIPTSSANAAGVEEFYAGRQMRMIIFASSGGGYDTYARLLARHIVNFIPGKPTMVSSNMPGGGGIKAVNYVARSAPTDGSIMTIVNQGIPMHQSLNGKGLETDLSKFGWVGNISYSNQTFATWTASGAKSLDDLKSREVVVGATGIGSIAAQLPASYNNLLNTRLKIIYAYPGASEMNLAMERGEIHARGSNPLASWKATNPEWIKEKKITFLIQIGLEREPELPNVPLLTELVKGDAEKESVARFLTNNVMVGRPFAVAPGVPKERLAALRQAYEKTIVDAKFLAEARKQKMDIRSMTGERLQALVEEIIATPQGVRDKAREAITAKGAEARKGAKKKKKKKKE
ncbi:MAG: Bug family tripartite tricarboxylate transporter substrate binding protein [Alphaproteobacteria bacterium]